MFQGAEQIRNRHRLLLLIDEFPSLNRMEIFADALSYMAGYGLKAYLITQDIRQIVDAYGNNESIVSNCHVRIAFAPNQVETAELLSKMTGTQTVQKASYNFSGSRFSPVMGHINASVDHIERPLMTPDEVLRLQPPQKQSAGDTERIVAPGQMLIFVSGNYPILGTQMLYFLDPVLTERASLKPPTRFFAIEDGRIMPQKPAGRTRNKISKPEPGPSSSSPTQRSAGSWKSFGSGRERTDADESCRSRRVHRQEARGSLSPLGHAGRECAAWPDLPVSGQQPAMARTHELAQPVVLRRPVESGGGSREG